MHGHSDPKTFDGLTAAVSKRHGGEMKARQNSKIKEIREALRSAGFLALDAQAGALGLSRSTTWTILQGRHKSSGLSTAIINRMLEAPQLPPSVRATILEYVQEKSVGLYGHSTSQLRKFKARLSNHALTIASEGEGNAPPKGRLL
jgi:hypothetical protein